MHLAINNPNNNLLQCRTALIALYYYIRISHFNVEVHKPDRMQKSALGEIQSTPFPSSRDALTM